MLPSTQDQTDLQVPQLRLDFQGALTDTCWRPQLAGLGLSVADRLSTLLVEHGVAPGEALDRARHVIGILQESHVDAALNASNAWREMKWLANQQRPPLSLIKPSELQAVVEQRGGTFQVGNKRHKQPKGQGKGHKAVQRLDASVLRLETGLFQSSEGHKLSQISLAGIGPNVSGVAIVNMAMADAYVRANKRLSVGSLGFLVVDSTTPPVTALGVSKVRVPLVCAVNSEPLLVDGLLIQLGAIAVERAPMSGGCAVQAVSTCVVKALIFRDMTKEPWTQVCAHPLKHIFSKVGPLQVCDDAECPGCEAWHCNSQFSPWTPLFLRFGGKQWMKLNFQFAPAEQAEMFGVHLRIPECFAVPSAGIQRG